MLPQKSLNFRYTLNGLKLTFLHKKLTKFIYFHQIFTWTNPGLHIKGHRNWIPPKQRKYKLLLYLNSFKHAKENGNECIAAISQAVLYIFDFKMDIPRKVRGLKSECRHKKWRMSS